MPTAPKKPCTFPGCSALVEQGTRCPAHQVARRVSRVTDRFRGTAASRGYDSRWQTFRPLWLGRYPLCAGVLLATPKWSEPAAREFHRLREAAREEGRLLLFGGLGIIRARQLPECCVIPAIAEFLQAHAIYDWAAWEVGQPGSVIDHIVPHRGNPLLFWAEWNLQTVTKRAHDKKTARE